MLRPSMSIKIRKYRKKKKKALKQDMNVFSFSFLAYNWPTYYRERAYNWKQNKTKQTWTHHTRLSLHTGAEPRRVSCTPVERPSCCPLDELWSEGNQRELFLICSRHTSQRRPIMTLEAPSSSFSSSSYTTTSSSPSSSSGSRSRKEPRCVEKWAGKVQHPPRLFVCFMKKNVTTNK